MKVGVRDYEIQQNPDSAAPEGEHGGFEQGKLSNQ